jgi:uncharacterized Rossmann fold enzyme
MDINEWETWYTKILNDFGFSRLGDERTADVLNDILINKNAMNLEDLYNYVLKKTSSNNYIVFGAGPSLKKDIINIKKDFNYEDYILIAADGATTALLEEDLVPDIIVTDLDGKISDLLIANSRDVAFVVHAHGDNEDKIVTYTNVLNRVMGTTQSIPEGKLYNFGGFTDGDRAIFLAVELGAEKIFLAGMDFGTMVTKYSRPNINEDIEIADEIKQKKLKYAEDLTNWISENENVDLIKLN